MSYQEIYQGLNKKASAEQVKQLAAVIGMRKRASGPFGDVPPPPEAKKRRAPTGGTSKSRGKIVPSPAPLMNHIPIKSNWQLIKGKLGQLFGGQGSSQVTPTATTLSPVGNTASGTVPKPTSGAGPKINPRFDFRSRRSAKLFGKTPRLLRFAKGHPVMSTLGTLLALGGTGAAAYGLGSAGKSDLQSALYRTQADNSKYVAQNNRLKTKGSGSLLQDFFNMLKFWYNRWFSGDKPETSSTSTNNTQGTK